MIDVLTNGFLTNPVPLQFTGNYCSHGCVYCFANINNPKRRLDVKAVASQLKNYRTRNDLPSFFMREKYPILISNNIDPFSRSNQPFVNDLIFSLQDMGIPVVLATRGGIGWEEVAKELTPSVWYVTIPYNEDEIRYKYEPNAPSVDERWEMVDSLIDKGHKVIISINPLNKEFVSSPIDILERATDVGIRSFVINKLHLSPKQQSNLNERESRIIGIDLLSECRLRGFQNDWLKMCEDIFEYCEVFNLNLLGMDTGLANDNYIEFNECYSNLLPTLDGFFNWCFDNKYPGEQVLFQEFFDYFSERLPTIEGNISKYIFNRAVIDDKDFYRKMDLRNLLHLYWQHPKVGLGLAKNYPAFSWLKKQYSSKLDYVFDKDHNQILHYNGYEYNSAESIILS